MDEEKCNCPYYDSMEGQEKDPECRNPAPCDYPFYCPLKEDKE